jgi:hypothetical protein
VTRNAKLFSAIVLVSMLMGAAAANAAALSQRPRRIPPGRPARTSYPLPRVISFREVSGRGLLARVWLNGIGPFNFAIDTGAGATIISPRVADEANVTRTSERATIAGLSGVNTVAQHASINTFALGDSENLLPGKGTVLVSAGLPGDLDGLLDPIEAFSPFGLTIDLPRRELTAFDPNLDPLKVTEAPADGAIVPWLHDGNTRRPFVMLDNGDRALLDTGSSLGLAVRDPEVTSRRATYAERDIGGGRISARRGQTNIAIGSLTLRRIPTDFVTGTGVDAPVLLGLAALRPFRLRFDPLHRLIEISAESH